MELAVVWVVLIGLATFVVGLIAGWALTRRRTRPAVTATTSRIDPSRSAATSGETEDGSGSGSEGSGTHSSSVPDAAGVGGHRLDPTTDATGTAHGQVASGASRLDAERDERRRYADIIGIETENASLRAVAARVPALERRIRELEALSEPSVESGIDPVIDLTGPTPVVHDSDADVAAR